MKHNKSENTVDLYPLTDRHIVDLMRVNCRSLAEVSLAICGYASELSPYELKEGASQKELAKSVEKQCRIHSYLDGKKRDTVLLPSEVTEVYDQLTEELTAQSKPFEEKIKHYSNDAVYKKKVFFVEVAKAIATAQGLNIAVSPALKKALEDKMLYEEKLASDPLFEMNSRIKQGKNYKEWELRRKLIWTIDEFRAVVFGKGSIFTKSWSDYQNTKKDGAPHYHDHFFEMGVLAGRDGADFVINDKTVSPDEWEISPKKAIAWCREAGIYLRPQLSNSLEIVTSKCNFTETSKSDAGNTEYDDKQIVLEMLRLIVHNGYKSVYAAAKELACYANGGGTDESKARRISDKFKKVYQTKDISSLKNHYKHSISSECLLLVAPSN